jgi:type VI secretion system secreted protein Hcp
MALVDYFLKIGSLEGESKDAEYNGSKGWMQIESWWFGANQVGTMQNGGGGGAGRVLMKDFHFTMKQDKSMPMLFLACATGEHFKNATLNARKAGKIPQTFYTAVLSDCLVTKFETTGNAGADGIPLDVIQLNYAQIEITYKEQKPDGSVGAPIKAGYNIKANQAV